MNWTAEMDAALRHGRGQGHSASVLASQLGISRNAVLGRLFRLKMGGTLEKPFCPSMRADQEKLAEWRRLREAAKKALEEKRAIRLKVRTLRDFLDGVWSGDLTINPSDLDAMCAIAKHAAHSPHVLRRGDEQ